MSEETGDVIVWPNGEVVTPESVEAYADAARNVATPPRLRDGQIRTPDWAIGQLITVSEEAARMVLVILRAEELKREAGTALARVKASARLAAFDSREPGVVQSARVVQASVEAQEAYDRAVIAFEYARRVGNLLKDHTSRLQTIKNLIGMTYDGGGAQ